MDKVKNWWIVQAHKNAKTFIQAEESFLHIHKMLSNVNYDLTPVC
jgi:hypothetical protein